MFVTAPTPTFVDVVIAGLTPDTLDVRDGVEDEVAAAFTDRASVGTSQAAVFSRSWIDEAISRATGESRHVLVSPGSDVVATMGVLPVLGSLTFQA